jgi:hypothetical protein
MLAFLFSFPSASNFGEAKATEKTRGMQNINARILIFIFDPCPLDSRRRGFQKRMNRRQNSKSQ